MRTTKEGGSKCIVQKDVTMNEVMEEYIKDGLSGLAKLIGGTHLRPAELACTIVSVVAAPEAAQDIVLGSEVELKLPGDPSNG